MTIPGWALATMSGIGTLLIAWLVWLTVKTFDNQKDIFVNKANDENVQKELEKIYRAIEETKDSFKDSFDKLDLKFDTFLNNELQFFKEQHKKK